MSARTLPYSVVFDDDLDTWSVVKTPFDGVYFAGSKVACEAFAATRHRESALNFLLDVVAQVLKYQPSILKACALQLSVPKTSFH